MLAINIVGNWLLVLRYGYKASAYLGISSSATYLVLQLLLTPLNSFAAQQQGTWQWMAKDYQHVATMVY